MSFQDRLKEARKAKGLTLEALGGLLEASKQTLSSWENGRYEPNLEQLGKLCEILGCTADWLILGRSPEALPPDAVDEAKSYAKLTPEAKKRWRTLRMLVVDGAPDALVEKKMPVTKTAKH
jgi:transcriptional regulator with XRE-family HTH domain